MPDDTPEKLIPRRLDPRKLAQQGAVYRGTVPAEKLSRLGGAVASLNRVQADLEFKRAEQGERLMQGRIEADVELVCQRCLEPVSFRIASDFALAVVWDEDEAKHVPGAYDPWITGEGEGDIYDILEEELLLSLPLVAYHDEPCIDANLLTSGDDEQIEKEQKPNPFQVLQQLKGNIKK